MKIFKIVLVSLIAIALIVLGVLFLKKDKIVSKNIITITSQISGTISLNVENNYEIKKGEIIATIDVDKFKNELNFNQNKLEETQKSLKISTNNIYKTKALYKKSSDEIEIAKLNLDRANSDYILYRNAYRDEAVTKHDLDKAQKSLQKANNDYNNALNNQKKLNSKLEKINSDKNSQNNEIQKLMANINEIQQKINNSTILSPIDGKVKKVNFKSGDFVLEGKEILTIEEE